MNRTTDEVARFRRVGSAHQPLRDAVGTAHPTTGAQIPPRRGGAVLVEAMALGIPVVATDCPSGPREILQGGRLGPLVPVGDAGALADAMEATLRDPIEGSVLRTATGEYQREFSTQRYLDILGLRD